MKSFLALLILMISFTAFSCESFGDRVLLKENKKVEVDVIGQPTVRLIAREVGPVNIFGARVLANYSGFECEVVDVAKLSQGCWEIRVEWSPGSDFSGCDVEVNASSGKTYKAFLYMDYFSSL